MSMGERGHGFARPRAVEFRQRYPTAARAHAGRPPWTARDSERRPQEPWSRRDVTSDGVARGERFSSSPSACAARSVRPLAMRAGT